MVLTNFVKSKKKLKIVFKMNSSIIKWIKVIPTTNTPLYMYCSIVMKCDQNTKCDVIYSIQHLLVVWRNRFSIWESRTLISVVVWLLQCKILIVSQYFNCDPWSMVENDQQKKNHNSIIAKNWLPKPSWCLWRRYLVQQGKTL